MDNSSEDIARRSAETLAAGVAATRALADEPVYWSQERGPEFVRDMNPQHARRSAAAVRQGRRSAGGATLRALDRQGRRKTHETK